MSENKILPSIIEHKNIIFTSSVSSESSIVHLMKIQEEKEEEKFVTFLNSNENNYVLK